MTPEREAGQWLVVPGKEFSPLPQLDDVMLIEHKHGSLWAVHEAYARGYRAGAEAQRERVEALEVAANKLVDYCEDHDWGTMPEPFDSINPLLALLGRSAPIEGEKE